MVLLPLPGVTMTVTASRFVRQGKANARTLTRAWILLKLADGWDEGKIADNTIHQLLKKRAEWQTCLEMSEKCPWCHPKMSVPQAKFAIQPFFSRAVNLEWECCSNEAREGL